MLGEVLAIGTLMAVVDAEAVAVEMHDFIDQF